MKEQEFETLMTEVFQRQNILLDINKNVMHTVRAQHRKALARKWLKILAFSMGFPVVILIPIAIIWHALHSCLDVARSLSLSGSMAICIGALVYQANIFLKNFNDQV